ncbi:MAG: hypothetical protein PHT69_05775, partial [Bacteroidales bacterium]|nr:hypothetical protein [Bacteroidales bacterium]
MTAYNTKTLNSIFNRYKSLNLFYKEKLINSSNFFNSPLTQKKELIESQLINPTFGHFTNTKKPISQIYRTSGTHSNPLILTFTQNDIALLTDIGKESLIYSGMGKYGNKEVVINCLNYSMWTGGAFDAMAISKTGVRLVNFGAGNTRALINFIKLLKQDKKIKVSLHCTPSYLSIIEKILNEEFNTLPEKLGIFTFYLGGEAGIQNNAFRTKLMNIWKANIYNANYGMSEVSSTMASANDFNYLKFAKGFLNQFIVELKTNNNNHILFSDIRESDEGELVITSLNKESQALFRYNTKEVIRIIKMDAKDVYFEIVARTDDMFVYKGINVFPEQFREIISEFNDLSGNYKIKLKKESHNIISEIHLICERRHTSST